MTKWKDIPEYKGYYQVSDKGNIRSLDRKGVRSILRGRLLKPTLNNYTGYLQVILGKNGKWKCHRVHRLVALAFIPNPFNKSCVDHIDNCKTNNNVDNLQWLTVGENNSKAYRDGLRPKFSELNFERAVGSKHGRAKLDERKVIIIKYILHHKLATQGTLAKLYDVSQSRISEANSGKIWGHVKERVRPIFSYCKIWTELLLVYGS